MNPPIVTTAILEILNSKRDFYGNCYWAFEFTDVLTGKTVRGTISGGESNIRSITYGWSDPEDFDRTIRVETRELKIREFNRLTKGWDYAGCRSEEIAAFIKRKLAE